VRAKSANGVRPKIHCIWDNAGISPLIGWLAALFRPLPGYQTLAMHPILFAAWLGMLITGINLLPAGQLDGGHIAYSLFGRTAHTIALITFFSLLAAGWLLSTNWFVWAFFVVLGGLRHPPPLDDVSPVGLPRRILGWISIALFFLLIVPAPFTG